MLDQRLKDKPLICNVYFSFDKELDLVAGSTIQQNFFDALPPDTFQSVYVSRSKTQFRETLQETPAGNVFQQQVSISMPRSDYNRSEKINQILKARYIFLQLNNGRIIVVGRNDSAQNKKMSCRFSSDQHNADFRFTNRSIFPAGYTQLEGLGFPYQIPTSTP